MVVYFCKNVVKEKWGEGCILGLKTLYFRPHCQDVSHPKGFNAKDRPKPGIRPIDYHLECCIEARFWNMASIGRNAPPLISLEMAVPGINRWNAGLESF
jgi:hypothetical protein